MTIRRLSFSMALALLGSIVGGCDSGPAGQTPDGGKGGTEAGAEVCDHDGCIVPLAEVMGVCGPDLHARTNACPGVQVLTGPCGTLTHVVLKTAGPDQDCYFTTSTGELVGAVTRSDAGFTKIAGDVPTEACPATTQVCDHNPAI